MAIISSINPRELIRPPIADDSHQLKPQIIVNIQLKYLLANANNIIIIVGPIKSICPNLRMLLNPEHAKNTGSNVITLISLSRMDIA